MINNNELIGKKFNRLTIVEFAGINKYKSTLVKCLCKCGNYCICQLTKIRSGHTKSCGCRKKEFLSGEGHFKHGGYGTKLYQIWAGMKRRCYNHHEKSFANYGGRGITICNEWDHFENFKDWAIKSGYHDGLSIERVNVNGNYEPGNCEWIELVEQCHNKRNTVYATLNGETKRLVEWCDELAFHYGTVRSRISRTKCSPEEALIYYLKREKGER